MTIQSGTRRDPRTVVALKEWALVCDRLLAGEACVLFRKGGIDEKGFWVEADEFALFPTYFHQNRDKVRPAFAAAFDAAMARAPREGTLRIPGIARVVAAVEVRRPDRIGALEDLHPYTDDQIAMRLEFRPKKPLVLLAVEVAPLTAALEIPLREEYGGCSSWVPLEIGALPEAASPVLPREAVEAVAERLRGTVG